MFTRVLNRELTKEQLDALVYHLDVNNDGKIAVQEAVDIYKALQKKEEELYSDKVYLCVWVYTYI